MPGKVASGKRALLGWEKAWSGTSPAEEEKGVVGCKDSLNVQIVQNAQGRVFRVEMVTRLTLVILPLLAVYLKGPWPLQFVQNAVLSVCIQCGVGPLGIDEGNPGIWLWVLKELL